MKKVIFVLGQTGTGKTKLSLYLSKSLKCEIINCDSQQLYKGLAIATNKASKEELEEVPHHMLSILEPTEKKYHVQKFSQMATPIIEGIFNRDAIPIVCGGTMYYMESLLFTDQLIIEKNPNLLDLNKLASKFSFDLENCDSNPEYKLLSIIDPGSALKFHPNEIRKIKRSLQIYQQTGKKQSEIIQNQKRKLRFQPLILWTDCEQAILDHRLDERVDKMRQRGIIKEFEEFYLNYHQQFDSERGIFQAIGFKEFIPYLEFKFQNQIEKVKEEEEEEKEEDDEKEKEKCTDILIEKEIDQQILKRKKTKTKKIEKEKEKEKEIQIEIEPKLNIEIVTNKVQVVRQENGNGNEPKKEIQKETEREKKDRKKENYFKKTNNEIEDKGKESDTEQERKMIIEDQEKENTIHTNLGKEKEAIIDNKKNQQEIETKKISNQSLNINKNQPRFKKKHKQKQKKKIDPKEKEKMLLEQGFSRLKLVTRRYSRKQKKWIVNRLLDNVTTYHFDTSSPKTWENDVGIPALKICNFFLNNQSLGEFENRIAHKEKHKPKNTHINKKKRKRKKKKQNHINIKSINYNMNNMNKQNNSNISSSINNDDEDEYGNNNNNNDDDNDNDNDNNDNDNDNNDNNDNNDDDDDDDNDNNNNNIKDNGNNNKDN
ncbi:tRNA dimethylallyltransferase [Anaeramoeba flamelloides]|uniref:tRNA dimethylallyltransferase n=1 Tax=Anaeramoeba flamelloides TaxID=1746091 RepID=A0ABQ8YV67_9EUKA|nr:tRNA dimethylallyltransferase [Anaeramoeba flamelloides]